jgi:hypothetical protein
MGLIDLIFLWLIGGHQRKVLFDDQLCRSSKMAASTAILDLVSIDYLTNAWVDWSNLFVAYWGFFDDSTTAHSRWPPWKPSWIWFLSII